MIEVTTLSNTIYVTTYEDNSVLVTTEDPSPSQTGITFEDEGVALGTRGTVTEVDFVGPGVSAARSGDKVTVTVSASGGGGTGDVVGPASSTNNNIAVFSGTTGKLIADGGTTIAASLSNLMANLFFLDRADTTIPITNQPSAETYFISSIRHVKKFDATKYNYVRVVAHVTALSASVNSPRLYPKYKTTFNAADAVGTFTTVGSGTGTESASLAAVDIAVTDWITLPAGAKADVFWCVAEIGGDAAADPALSVIIFQFKV